MPQLTTADFVIVAGFVVWTVVSALRILRSSDFFPGPLSIFTPSWPLFAPNPVSYDYHLACRTHIEGNTFTRWQEVPSYSERRVWHVGWNPGFAKDLLLFKLAQLLVEFAEDEDAKVQFLRSEAKKYLCTYASESVAVERPVQIALFRKESRSGNANLVYISGHCNGDEQRG